MLMLGKGRYSCGNIIIYTAVTILAILMLFPGAFANVRYLGYNLFKQGAKVYLNYQTKDFMEQSSEHFILKYSENDEDTASFVLDMAEDFYAKVVNQLQYKLSGKAKIPIVIYPDEATLNESFGWSVDKSAAGVYWAGNIRLLSPHALAVQGSSLDEVKRIFAEEGPLSHELAHLFVDEKTRGNYTRWFTEGIAQYVEKTTTGFTLQEPGLEEKKELYQFSRMDEEFDNLPNQTLAYWQSLQAVNYLIEEYGMDKMNQFLQVLGNNRGFSEAFQEVYSISVKQFDNDIKKLLQI